MLWLHRRVSVSFLSTFLSILLAGSVVCAAQGKTVESQPEPIHWQHGPMVAQLGTGAQIKVPAGYQFADAAGTRRFLELTHNPPSEQEVGIVTPILNKDDADSKFWFVLFDFDETGYVKDDEKSSIDADKLFNSMKDATERGNEARRARGWSPFHLVGWQTRPFYDATTHNLTWGTVGQDDDPKNGQSVNYSTRILGRHGVMRVDLVLDPSQVNDVLPSFKSLMNGFSFTQGSRYADFVKGDKVAEYGLTALIAGGATAIALKTGIFAKLLAMLAALWKVIAVAFAALLTRIKNIFAAIKRKFGGDRSGPQGDDLSRP
ncbi:MAG TPA: DUF2167 domain-containing protein [Acidobacteriaceae bacterium]